MIVIVRHGNTFETDEAPRRIGALTDIPLTAKGIEQAEALGIHFAQNGWQFERLLVSPLSRTRQTAEHILTHQDRLLLPEVSDFLREIDHGPDENLEESLVLDRIGQQALNEWEKHGKVPAGWRIDTEVLIASWRALFEHVVREPVDTLLVTSNGAARFALLADAALAQQASKLGTLKLPTGGFGVIEMGEGGDLRLASWGLRP